MRDASLHRALIRDLRALDAGPVRAHEPLSTHGSWQIGGPADAYVEPTSWGGLVALRRYLHQQDVPAITIGDGSNLLFDDAGLRGVCVRIGRALGRFEVTESVAHAEAGCAMPRFARAVGMAGLTGLEHTIGIPGTLGGLLVMNGGSKRRSIGDNVVRVEAIDAEGARHVVEHASCGFAYRTSAFQDRGWIVARVEFRLEPGDRRAIWEEMLEILKDRRRKFPRRAFPNCGSVFVSGGTLYERFGPPGRVIEELGWKGHRIGDAEVSREHANFFVNRGRATSADMRELIRLVRESVTARTGIEMQSEVRHVSPSGEIRPVHETF